MSEGQAMYKSFSVSNFRGLRELKIDSLDRINLIAGKNNVGKTTLLEALWLHSAPNQPRLGISVDAFRGLDMDIQQPFHDLFWRFDYDSSIQFSASGDWGVSERVLKIKLGELDVTQLPISNGGQLESQSQQGTTLDETYSDRQLVFEYTDELGESFESVGWIVENQIGRGIGIQLQGLGLRERRTDIGRRSISTFLASRVRGIPQVDSERFGKLEIENQHGRVESLLRRVEPRLRRMTVIPRGSVPMLHADLGDEIRLLPLPLLGDGIARLSSLGLAIGNARDGHVFIDEVENGLHHTVMQQVWSGIAEFAREFNVQIFATTHSEECVRAAHEAFSLDEKYDFRLHRLERVKDSDSVRAVTYDQETLDIALRKGLEFR